MTKRYGSAHRPVAPADDHLLPPMFRAQAYRDSHLRGTVHDPAPAPANDPRGKLNLRGEPVDPPVQRIFAEAPGEWSVRAP